MAARGVLRTIDGGRLAFWCPGCEEAHQVRADHAGGPNVSPNWGFNGDYEQPTFEPSIKVTSIKVEGGDAEIDRIIETYKLPEDRKRMLADRRINTVCHSYVRGGVIEFLSDCTHALAGQKVELKPFGGE